jgi:hypothetical protein
VALGKDLERENGAKRELERIKKVLEDANKTAEDKIIGLNSDNANLNQDKQRLQGISQWLIG